MEAKIDALIKEVSSLSEQTRQLKKENMEIRSQIAEMKSRMTHSNDDEEEEHEDDQSGGFLCWKSSGQTKRNVAPPGRTTHPTRGHDGDDHEMGAPGATTHPSRGKKKALPVFKPKNTEAVTTVASDSKPEYSQV
jgi:TolA-binding protein